MKPMRTIALRVDLPTYNKFSNITTSKGASMASELREMLNSYIDETGALNRTAGDA